VATTDQLINTLFDGRYRIVRKLGSGGMANVYLAEDQELGRRVAIKILNDRHAGDEQFIERFRREAKNAAILSHPNIVSIYDRGEAEGTYYIAMEYLDGRSLKELILTRGPAPVSVSIDYARQILAALRFAHRNGIVHRDIKPHNCLVDADGHVKVTDFGIARAGTSQMTEEGSIIGTAQYLSPEQARGTQVDQRSDLYSLGIVLYELLTGTVPFTGDTPVEIAMKHLSATPEPVSAKRPDVPKSLDLVVLRALAKNPADRYQTADEMDADLERVARGLRVSRETEDAATTVLRGAALAETAPTTVVPAAAATAVRERPPAPPGRDYFDYDEPMRRRPVWPWLLAVLLVAGAAVGGFYVYRQIQDQLDQARPVGVPYVVGLREIQAVTTLRDAGLSVPVDHIHRQPNDTEPVTYVFRQDPQPGERVGKGTFVDIWVSTGKAQVQVPFLIGETSTTAVARLTSLKLEADVHRINSGKPVDTVIAQDPKGGTKVDEHTKVRINVSSGPKPVGVPDERGRPYDSAASALQAQGFAVARVDVQSDQPAGIVIAQSPAPNTFAPPRSTVTLTVSTGPPTSTVPEVESSDVETAKSTLQASGFKAHVVKQDTDSPSLDGIVISQDPAAGTQAKPGTKVTIVVGKYKPPPPPPPTTETTPATTTVPTTTAATTTTTGGPTPP
jgi:beta-lactam-binding protein with PASTA domain/predicted Ser/Thr protein kinase